MWVARKPVPSGSTPNATQSFVGAKVAEQQSLLKGLSVLSFASRMSPESED